MEKTDNYRSRLFAAADQISAENLSSLDFDELRRLLIDSANHLEQAEQVRADNNRLRDDFMARIAGMEKAIAVAARGESHLRRALELIDTLSDLTAEKLIEQYNRTLARFRDAFPASFGCLQTRVRPGSRNTVHEYK